ISDLLVAALLHDEGKRLDSFQAALGGNGASDGALAKSGLPRRLWAQSRHDAGLPARFRHEALSAAAASVLGGELAAHLVGASHGHGRPWFPPARTGPDAPIAASLGTRTTSIPGNPLQAGIAPGLAERFTRLNDQFGPWG